MFKLLFIGDIVGRPGQAIDEERIPRIRRELALDFVIANGENAAAGAGITGLIARSILECGVDADHPRRSCLGPAGMGENEIAGLDRVCRPANLPAACPGWDHVVVGARGFKLAVFTVLGRHYMNMKAECPFLCADRMIERLKGQADAILVEIHAEATSEKQALGWHLDGRVTAVLGTHTHVPTADARVLPKGTAFICDVGMTRPLCERPPAVRFAAGRRPLHGAGMPRRFEVATDGDVRHLGGATSGDRSPRWPAPPRSSS